MEHAMLELIIGSVAKLLDKIIPDPAQRDAAKLELLKAENQQVLTEMQTQLSAILAEANSADPWTSRARPSFLYVMYFMIVSCVLGGIIGIWFPEQTQQAAANINALLKAIPNDLYTLFGLGYLGYTGARSFEKWAQK
jgi:uncharacterized membrane protein YraQ (UPF0718 family)